MKNSIRPDCEHITSQGNVCGNPATLVRTLQDGSKSWRTTNGLWTCHSCHFDNTPNLKPELMYTRHKKSYCENQDGRLGKICTANITYQKELTVDHIDGNHSNDDPDNLQTLCASCHNLKTHQDYKNKTNTGPHYKYGGDLETMFPDLFGTT